MRTPVYIFSLIQDIKKIHNIHSMNTFITVLKKIFYRLQGKKRRYLDIGVFKKVSWEPTDVIISSSPKQGANWNLNIVHQLRMSGDDTFKDILTACLWIEFLSYPGENRKEILNRVERQKEEFPFRIFKTHEAPPTLPFHEKIKYIIPVRNGKDTLVSDYYFSQKRTDAFNKLWNAPTVETGSFSSYVDTSITTAVYWRFINKWWQYRYHKNVLFVHFSDLKKEPEKNIRKIASFLNIQISEERWPIILEHCSFGWMKANSVKFESPLFTKSAKMVKDGGMIRKGNVGEHRNLFSDRDNRVWEEIHRKYFPDDLQRKWTDQGGPLP